MNYVKALLSIEIKAFPCEGGSIYGLLAQEKIGAKIRFIVAYQTISDDLNIVVPIQMRYNIISRGVGCTSRKQEPL
ncbi:DUF2600 family protein [Nostoc sp. CHAB 5715]|uniref:DUF2600 family protein n=1 Tax=Nostoc sp. CHAB 5715 TaxID=2780400 RepID=UPI001E53152B|nr:DUF2600 family protein [Nostoc sp. CHAB 5715]MCC5623203.1 DUF2600 family protein [Nostoc sp. CHAB 5715]